jgi:hypothetical protein
MGGKRGPMHGGRRWRVVVRYRADGRRGAFGHTGDDEEAAEATAGVPRHSGGGGGPERMRCGVVGVLAGVGAVKSMVVVVEPCELLRVVCVLGGSGGGACRGRCVFLKATDRYTDVSGGTPL